MPSKTVARSGAKTSRSKAGSTPKRPAASKRKAPARRPGPQRPSPIATAGVAVGRASRATWLLAARGVGGTARSVGRARDIDPGHRRDGIALALIGIAGVIAASTWFDAARPVGAWIDGTLRTLVGSAAVLLPLIIAVVAVLLAMVTAFGPEAKGRKFGAAALQAAPSET